MLHIVLAESALELVPQPIWDHPAVVKSARARGKRPEEVLLDDTFHHSALTQAEKRGTLDDVARRGRPDIVHFSLLIALESRLNKKGGMRVSVHTRNDQSIQVDPAVRLQRAQHRFAGLMERLLADGAVPTPEKGPPLLRLERNVALPKAIEATGARSVMVLDEAGEDEAALEALLSEARPGHDVAFVVGGFPHGALRSDLSGIPHRSVRLGDVPLAAWTVVAELVVRGHAAAPG